MMTGEEDTGKPLINKRAENSYRVSSRATRNKKKKALPAWMCSFGIGYVAAIWVDVHGSWLGGMWLW